MHTGPFLLFASRHVSLGHVSRKLAMTELKGKTEAEMGDFADGLSDEALDRAEQGSRGCAAGQGYCAWLAAVA
jgi:hypothetical protein